MKPLLIFVKSSIVGGLLFLVPLVVLVIVVAKAFDLAHRLAQPIASMLRVDSVDGVILSDLIAIASLVLLCFLAGLVARWSFGSRWVGKAEARLLWGVPGYGTDEKSISHSTVRMGGSHQSPNPNSEAMLRRVIDSIVAGKPTHNLQQRYTKI
jgi:hypothetical protein